MPADKSSLSRSERLRYYASNLFLRGFISGMCLLPYTIRVPLVGWLSAYVFSPLAGFRRRIRSNLKLTNPDLPLAEVDRLVRAVPDNAGRMIIEYYSTEPFVERARTADLTGPGVAALEEARAAGRSVIIITAHFGNYEAIRARLLAAGHPMGVLYRRMANPYFNDHYTDRLAAISEPIFEQGRRGMRDLVKHLRGGGILGILNDVHAFGGEPLTFFGQPAITSLITAELALKFDSVLIPSYAVRQENGLDFKVELHAPVPHTDPVAMTQAINNDVEDMVRRHMGQWFWIHRRWKDARGRYLRPDDNRDA